MSICSGDFAEVYTRASIRRDRDLDTIKNISFDYKTATITGAGQVYFYVQLKDGPYLFLDPAHCSRSISDTWSRADFTGTTEADACTVYDNSSNSYTSDGTMNALQVYGASHPDSVVTIVDMVFSGSAVVDRIALGTNKLYGWGISRAFSCGGDEANC